MLGEGAALPRLSGRSREIAGGVTSLAGLQSLLSSLGVNLSTTQIQNLLTQLGITDLSSGLTQLDLSRILQALGLGQTLPTG
jgi:hypothetical protein